jgi:hypothetical protein
MSGSRRSVRSRQLVWAICAAILAGSACGCTPDSETQTIIWEGMNTFSKTLVDALFQALKPPEQPASTQAT